MRLRFLLLAAVFTAACAPKPCAKALCPVSSVGLYEVRGLATVAAPEGTPLPPVPPDAAVDVRAGRAEFRVSKSRVVAEAGASFRFFLSSGAPALDVASGPVSVGASTAMPTSVSGLILLQ